MAKRALNVRPVKNPSRDVRKTANQRGYSFSWRQYSESYRVDHPVCIACVTVFSASDCVDHIIPMESAGDPLFFRHWNHQPLCRTCHGIKTNSHDDKLRARRGYLLRGLDELELEKNTDAARNKLLTRAGIWSQWFNLDDLSVVTLSL